MSINLQNAASAAVSACGGFSAGRETVETGPEKQEPSGGKPHRSRSAPARVPPTRARVTAALSES
jgi:hypothetical protein